MKKILTILILIFTLQTPSLADDIRDFQIEGMSIGDSLLDYMTKNEIKKNTLQYFSNQRKYYVVGMINNLKSYEQVEIYLKSKDKKYEIRSMAGMLMINNLKNCLKKKRKL